MEIFCETCGTPIPVQDIDLKRGIAKCAACNSLFSCRQQLDGLGVPARVRQEVALPKGMQLFTRTNGLRIVRRWFGAKFIFLTFFCLFWDGFMVVWYGIAIRERIWPMAAFGVIHLAVGIGLTYYLVAGYLNRTVVTVLHGRLAISHGPVPVPGNLSLTVEDFDQLYTKRHVSEGKNGTTVTYELRARMRDGSARKLIGGMTKKEDALFMEQQIETFLGIRDEPVDDEIAS